jgi:hypothetical protein
MLKAQPNLDALRAMREVDGQHRDVRDALVAFVLEMVLREPQRLVAERVGGARERDGRVERLRQPRVRIPAVVGRRAGVPAVLQLDVPDVERRESPDHQIAPSFASASMSSSR